MEQKIILFPSANRMPISLLEWFVTKWKKAQTKNREENQSSGLLLLQTQALSYETAKRLKNVFQDLFRAKIDDIQTPFCDAKCLLGTPKPVNCIRWMQAAFPDSTRFFALREWTISPGVPIHRLPAQEQSDPTGTVYFLIMRWERIRPIRRDRRAIRKFNVETEAFAIQHRTVAAFETVPVAGIVGFKKFSGLLQDRCICRIHRIRLLAVPELQHDLCALIGTADGSVGDRSACHPCFEKLICCTSVMGTAGVLGVLAHPGSANAAPNSPSSEVKSANFPLPLEPSFHRI